jgi:predicted O-methyltransferase YrrM
MVKITDPTIDEYLMSLSKEDDKQLLEMEEFAREKHFPIVDRLVGRLLFILTKLKNPKLIVELGSGFGYSAYWFAKALSQGKVVLTDYEEKNLQVARKTFKRAGLLDKIELRAGDGREIAKEYSGIDILFIDIEKYQYLEAIKILLPNLNRHALIIADNSLWYGRVLEEAADKETAGIKKFNEFMFTNKDFFTTIIPLRDGVLLSYKVT